MWSRPRTVCFTHSCKNLFKYSTTSNAQSHILFGTQHASGSPGGQCSRRTCAPGQRLRDQTCQNPCTPTKRVANLGQQSGTKCRKSRRGKLHQPCRREGPEQDGRGRKQGGRGASERPLDVGHRGKSTRAEHRRHSVSSIMPAAIRHILICTQFACLSNARMRCSDDGDPPLCSLLFLFQQAEAAGILGIAPCTLKQVCRELSLGRWPWRQHSCPAASAGPSPLLAPDDAAGPSRWERQNAQLGGLLDEALTMEL